MPPYSFDLVVVIAITNHLNDDTYIHLQEDEKAVKIYQELFKKIFALLKVGDSLIITDYIRKNTFSWLSNKLGIPDPNAPMIDWSKHQKPKLWIEILKNAGFINVTNR